MSHMHAAQLHQARKERDDVQKKLDAAVLALRWYAGDRELTSGNPYAVTNGDTWNHDGVSQILRDKGKRARSALYKILPDDVLRTLIVTEGLAIELGVRGR